MNTRHGSVYLAVLGVVSVVTVMTLAGVAIRKNLNERARLGIDTGEARALADSAAELAIQAAMNNENDFRTKAATGSLFADLPLGSGEISATTRDVDTGTTPVWTTSRYKVTAGATAGDSRSRLSFELKVPDSELLALAKEYGAISYWPLDETSNTSDAEDLIGGHTGAYGSPNPSGSASHDHGNPSPQITLGPQRVRVPHHEDFLCSQGTVAFWVRWDYRPVLGAVAAAVSKEYPTKDRRSYFTVYLEGDGDLVAVLNNRDDEGGEVKVSGKISTGRWYHIAVTWKSKLNLYIDGVLVRTNSSVDIGFDSDSDVSANDAPWMFGARNVGFAIFGAPQHAIGGSVCRVLFFDDNLGEKEIQSLYEADSASHGFEIEPNSFARVVD